GALARGATAAQLGTAFLLCPEAGTAPVHRDAIVRGGTTTLTRAFTGRRARAVINEFLERHDPHAPRAYPHVLNLTRPVLAAARDAGDPATINLWAGQAHPLARAAPAAEIVNELSGGARAALEAAINRSAAWG
ncbi:MAG TPA: nitronate monooxygenase, partial [Micromonosporaceae bacterium]